MKFALFSGAILAAPLIAGCHPGRTGRSSDSCSEVHGAAGARAAVETFTDAFRRGDVAKASALLHEHYVHTNGGSSPLSRSAWLDWFRERSEAIERGDFQVVDYQVSDLRFAVVSGTAVATALIATTSKTPSGTQDATLRVTQVWVCEDRQWKRLAFHDGPSVESDR